MDPRCPNLNCQIILPFDYADAWGFAECPYCSSPLVLNNIYYPQHWLISARRNPDEQSRAAERRAGYDHDIQAQAAIISNKLRTGQLLPVHVEAAARLGHKAAQQVIPEHTVDWTNDLDRTYKVYYPLFSTDPDKILLVLCDYVETQLLPLFLAEHPGNNLFNSAISAIKQPQLFSSAYPVRIVERQIYRFIADYGVEPPIDIRAACSVLPLIQIDSSRRTGLFSNLRDTGFRAGFASRIEPLPVADRQAWRAQALFIAEGLLKTDAERTKKDNRRNPDSDLRRLERIFNAEPTRENRRILNDARLRLGLPLVLDIPENWQEWAANYPPEIVYEMPKIFYDSHHRYIAAESILDKMQEANPDIGPLKVVFYNHMFYVVPK